jgi:predicted phosphate transport protein (TIGR00153 family)
MASAQADTHLAAKNGGDMKILKTRIGIEKQVETFLNHVSLSGLIFRQGCEYYLYGNKKDFERKLQEITDCEHKADELRRTINERLFTKTLIPESRGDVMELLENMDSLLDRFKGAMWRFEMEHPDLCEEFHSDFLQLIETVIEANEAIVSSCRAFFTDITTVSTHLHKVSYWESESDKISIRLQSAIFAKKDLRLSHRMQQRDFARHLDKIADRAEDIADKLNIYVIKRSL